jgi:hypothetical protein
MDNRIEQILLEDIKTANIKQLCKEIADITGKTDGQPSPFSDFYKLKLAFIVLADNFTALQAEVELLKIRMS